VRPRRCSSKASAGKLVESPARDIQLELAIPDARVELDEPLAELRELFGREMAERGFDFAQSAHGENASHIGKS